MSDVPENCSRPLTIDEQIAFIEARSGKCATMRQVLRSLELLKAVAEAEVDPARKWKPEQPIVIQAPEPPQQTDQFLNLVRRMRERQIAYFNSRTAANLNEAKVLEREVDKILEKYTPQQSPQQHSLFEQSG